MNYRMMSNVAGAAAICAVLAGAPSEAQSAVSFTPGDILVGFQADGGTGAGSNYVFNLGQGSGFRDQPGAGVILNLGADLSATYGTNWFSRADLHWAIGGVRTNAAFEADANAIVNGDPARTLYVGKAADSPGGSVPFGDFTAQTVTLAASEMMDMQSGFRTVNGTTPRDATATSDNRGVVQGTGDINSWSSVVDGAPWGIFTGAVQGSFGGADPATLDLYRILGQNPPGTVNGTTPGQSVYVTSFTIDSTGAISAVPEPSVAILAMAGAGWSVLRRRRGA